MSTNTNCWIDPGGEVACGFGPAPTQGSTTMYPNPPQTAASYVATPVSPPSGPGSLRTPPPGPTEPPDCCVHITTQTLEQISPDNPATGVTDCPSHPTYDGQEVQVIAVQPDGQGGMQAAILAPWNAMGSALPRPVVWPVCTAGPQNEDPIPCCLVDTAQGQVVRCNDPSHPAQGMSAEQAVAAGLTLEVCVRPPRVPTCCVELGQFPDANGTMHNGRLVCDDPQNELHFRPVDVSVSSDGTMGAINVSVGDTEYTLEIPVCEIEEEPDEVPCCLREGRLWCPETPDYHGMSYEEFQRLTGGTLQRCPEEPPPGDLPECCVRIAGDTPVIVCTDTQSPWHGYGLPQGTFNCFQQPDGRYVCEFTPPGAASPEVPCFDVSSGRIVGGTYDGITPDPTMVGLTSDGQWADIDVSGDAQIRLPTCGSSMVRLPVCPDIQLPPPRCCYDVATGTLLCPDDPGSQYNGATVSLEDLGSDHAVVYHPDLGRLRLPLCERDVPEGCCFRPAEQGDGSTGVLLCPTSPALDGVQATLLGVFTVGGILMGQVAWPGGAARLPLCREPCPDKPDCPPPYFCCVNTDTGVFVCPGNPGLHGQPAPITGVEETNGQSFVRLQDGRTVPACGRRCRPPTPCPECPPCKPCPECEDWPPRWLPPGCEWPPTRCWDDGGPPPFPIPPVHFPSCDPCAVV